MARTRTVTTQVTEETWQAVKDIANLWGESVSKATDRLTQRGLISIEKELGSKTPAYVKLVRIEEELRLQESSEERLFNLYNRTVKLGDRDRIKQVQQLAQDLKIELADVEP